MKYFYWGITYLVCMQDLKKKYLLADTHATCAYQVLSGEKR